MEQESPSAQHYRWNVWLPVSRSNNQTAYERMFLEGHVHVPHSMGVREFAPDNLCGFPGFPIELVMFGPFSGTDMPMGGPK